MGRRRSALLGAVPWRSGESTTSAYCLGGVRLRACRGHNTLRIRIVVHRSKVGNDIQMNRGRRITHPLVMVRSRMRRRIGLEGPALDENGFTLIELVITVVILPIVIGGITVALLSVFSLQSSMQSRIGNSNDELVSASTFNKDVQSAQQIETVAIPRHAGRPYRTDTARRTGVGPGLQRGLPDGGLLRVVPTVTTVAPPKPTNSSSGRSAPPAPPPRRRVPGWSPTTSRLR